MKNASAGVGRYECIVQAHNRHGWSEPSTIHTYHHNPGAFTFNIDTLVNLFLTTTASST